MDSVRFGRALGFGARHAAKAIAGAVDAAIAPNPTPVRKPSAQPSPATPPPQSSPAAAARSTSDTIATAARATARAQVRVRQTTQGVARGSKRFGQSALGPLAKLSKILWLEITGSFFGIFALFAGQAAWINRADLHPTPTNHEAHIHALVFVTMAGVFGYFCLSSFVRAYRR